MGSLAWRPGDLLRAASPQNLLR